MMREFVKDALPRIFPLDTVESTETFTAKQNGQYIPEKSPVDSISSVALIEEDDTSIELTEPQDFERVYSSTPGQEDKIALIEVSDSVTSEYTDYEIEMTYRATSIMSRYVDSLSESADVVDNEIQQSVEAKSVETASGRELDRIGRNFGEIGLRAGRDDETYRMYLKGLGEAYDSQGTKTSISSLASILVSTTENDVSPTDISFEESFDTQLYSHVFDEIESENYGEYVVIFDDFERHRISQLYTVLEVADPSGVRFIGPAYKIEESPADIREGPPVTEDNIDKVSGYDSPEDVPSDLIYPIGEKYTVPELAEIFGEDVVLDERLTYTFEWAEQRVTSTNPQSANDWNSFQWDDGDWGSDGYIEWTIEGDEWDFADWNFIPSLGTFVSTEQPSISDSTRSYLYDRISTEGAGVSDGLRVRFLVGEEVVSSDDSVTSEVVLSPETTAILADTGSYSTGEKAIDESVIADSTSDEIKNTTSNIIATNDAVTVDVQLQSWGTGWSNLAWSAQ